MTCKIKNVTGHSAPPRPGARLTGSVQAMTTRITASARIAVPQMTVHTRQILRNRGSCRHSSSQDAADGRTQRREPRS